MRLGDRLLAFVDGGRFVLGICNGFQALVRLGLLPRMAGTLRQEVTLTYNLSNHYECRWVTLKSSKSRCVFVPEGWTMRCPAAHGEGLLLAANAREHALLGEEGYVVFHYVDDAGMPTETYPCNPNGSPHGIAGLTDVTGRVLGLMPHPDRAYLPHHMPDWRRTGLGKDGDGLALFAAMVRATG
jgi:phosphoribosylformylglycinamidine synthase